MCIDKPNWKVFIEYSSTMHDVYNNIDNYNPKKKKENSNCVWWYDCWYK